MAVDGQLKHFCFSLVAESFVYAVICKHDWKVLDSHVCLRNGSIKGEGCLEDSPKSMRTTWWIFIRLCTWWMFEITCVQTGWNSLLYHKTYTRWSNRSRTFNFRFEFKNSIFFPKFKAWIACLRITQIKRVTCLQ